MTVLGMYLTGIENSMAALSEGFCPDDLSPLAPDAGGTVRIIPGESWQPGGWCPRCETWWHVRKGSEFPVCAFYPVPPGWPGSVLI